MFILVFGIRADMVVTQSLVVDEGSNSVVRMKVGGVKVAVVIS